MLPEACPCNDSSWAICKSASLLCLSQFFMFLPFEGNFSLTGNQYLKYYSLGNSHSSSSNKIFSRDYPILYYNSNYLPRGQLRVLQLYLKDSLYGSQAFTSHITQSILQRWATKWLYLASADNVRYGMLAHSVG